MTYTGGCHCGKVRFEVETDLGMVIECNCSHCAKKGFLLTFVPADAFRIDTDENDLIEYRFNKKLIAHLVCPVCGVQSYGRGKNKEGADTVAVNVRCLDEVDITSLSITPFDGKNF